MSNVAFPGFIRGSHKRYTLFAVRLSIARKKAMLRHFVSENGEKLVRHFGFQNQFRPIAFPISTDDEQFGLCYPRFGKYRFGLGVIACGPAFIFLLLDSAAQIAGQLAAVIPGSKLILPVCGILTAFLAVASICARRSAESRLLYAAGIVGMIGGLIARFG